MDATLAAEVRPTEAVFRTWPAALDHATVLSRDPGVLAVGVVRFTLDEWGTRTGVAMFVHGRGQQVPYVSDCRALYANGRKVSAIQCLKTR